MTERYPARSRSPSLALGQQVLAEVTPETDQPQASAIDGRMYQAQGPRWHQRDREQDRIPTRLRNVDTESAWPKSGYRGWIQGYRLVLQGLVFPAPVPLFARWCPNAVGESTVVTEALGTDQLPVTELLLGDSTFGGADHVALYAQHGGWLLTPKRVTSKPAQPKAWPARAPLSSPVCGSIKSSFWATIDTIDQSLVARRLSMKDDGASPPELRAGFNYLL